MDLKQKSCGLIVNLCSKMGHPTKRFSCGYIYTWMGPLPTKRKSCCLIVIKLFQQFTFQDGTPPKDFLAVLYWSSIQKSNISTFNQSKLILSKYHVPSVLKFVPRLDPRSFSQNYSYSWKVPTKSLVVMKVFQKFILRGVTTKRFSCSVFQNHLHCLSSGRVC